MCGKIEWTFVLTLLSTPCLAQTPPQYFGLAEINPGSDLSVREEPDATAAVVAHIPWNVRQVRGFGCTNDTPSGLTWCRVKYRGVVGWARRRYLVPAS
jgi:uncharacterized protein YraI